MIIKVNNEVLNNPQIKQLVLELVLMHKEVNVYTTAFDAYCEEEAECGLSESTNDDAVKETAHEIGKYLSDDATFNDAIDNIVSKRCHK